jgi:1,4-alpha-glucan branching enzyme
MGIRKMYVKNKDVCKVTFTVSSNVAGSAVSAFVVGDFNNWEVGATPMKKTKDGSFSTTLNLSCGNEYQFRYLLDGEVWENDCNADKYVFCQYGGCDNSVIVV